MVALASDIGQHIVDFFLKTAVGIYSKLGSNDPYWVHYFYVELKSETDSLASDWLTYKNLVIFKTFCFKFLNNTF